MEGTATEARGRAALFHVANEVVQLCEVIERIGFRGAGGEPETVVLFGELFEVYADISDKVVGMLRLARKYGLCFFEGETLWQRIDDERPVLLLATAEQARELLCTDGDPENFRWGALAPAAIAAEAAAAAAGAAAALGRAAAVAAARAAAGALAAVDPLGRHGAGWGVT